MSANATLDAFLSLQEPSDYSEGYFLVTLLQYFLEKLYSIFCLNSSDADIYGMNIDLRGM